MRSAIGALERIPRLRLATLPTPVTCAPTISQTIGCEVWVKRDDLTCDLYGGNKVRKLEFLLADAQARGKKRLVTTGGIGSNHVLATAIFGAQLAMTVDAILYPQPMTPHVEAVGRALVALGVRIHRVASPLLVPALAIRAILRGAHMIAPGGSSGRGALGYVLAAFELAEQIRTHVLPTPRAIYVPLGSGGTVAGLALGLGLAGLSTRLVAVRVTPRVIANRYVIDSLVRAAARLLNVAPQAVAAEIAHQHYGRQYGEPTEAARRAVELAARDDLRLETTYTGKMLAALLASGAEPQAQAQDASGPLLAWNTFNSRSLPGELSI